MEAETRMDAEPLYTAYVNQVEILDSIGALAEGQQYADIVYVAR
jgi:hypothetical protein